MKIYLAARYERREELCGYRQRLQNLGFDVPAVWLNGEHELGEEEVRRKFALDDYRDVRECDIFICFTEEPRSGHSRGGRHVEFGMATALQKKIFIVGPLENIFYYLPDMIHCDSWGECFFMMTDMAHMLHQLHNNENKYIRADDANEYLVKAKALNELSDDAHANSKVKGFWPDGKDYNFGEKIALIHSELSEALEKHRKTLGKGLLDQPDEHCPTRGGIEIELADAIIRILDLAGAMSMSIGDVVIAKMAFNATRPHKHGKAY